MHGCQGRKCQFISEIYPWWPSYPMLGTLSYSHVHIGNTEVSIKVYIKFGAISGNDYRARMWGEGVDLFKTHCMYALNSQTMKIHIKSEAQINL